MRARGNIDETFPCMPPLQPVMVMGVSNDDNESVNSGIIASLIILVSNYLSISFTSSSVSSPLLRRDDDHITLDCICMSG